MPNTSRQTNILSWSNFFFLIFNIGANFHVHFPESFTASFLLSGNGSSNIVVHCNFQLHFWTCGSGFSFNGPSTLCVLSSVIQLVDQVGSSSFLLRFRYVGLKINFLPDSIFSTVSEIQIHWLHLVVFLIVLSTNSRVLEFSRYKMSPLAPY